MSYKFGTFKNRIIVKVVILLIKFLKLIWIKMYLSKILIEWTIVHGTQWLKKQRSQKMILWDRLPLRLGRHPERECDSWNLFTKFSRVKNPGHLWKQALKSYPLVHHRQWRSQKFRLGGARLKDKIGNKKLI